MFGRRFFGARYYAPRYFGDGGTSAAPDPGGGGSTRRRLGHFFSVYAGLIYNRISIRNP